MLQNVNFAKSILMLCVIAGHSALFWSGNWFTIESPLIKSSSIGDFGLWLGTFHTYSFTLLSGYIYSYIINRGGYSRYKDFLVKKFKRLIIPYIFVSVFWVIPICCFFYHYSILDIINNYVFGRSPQQLWFLLMLFDVFAIFHILITEISNRIYVVLPLCLLCYILSLLIPVEYNYFQIVTSLQYILFFAIGYLMWIKRNMCFRSKAISLAKWPFLCFLVIIDIGLFMLLKKDIGFRTLILSLLNFEGAITFSSLLMFVGKKINTERACWKILEKHSFTMYLLHQQIIFVSIVLLNGLICPSIHLVLNFVISTAVSLVISVLLHRNSLLRILLGEKR